MINIKKTVVSTYLTFGLSLILTVAVNFTGYAQTQHQNDPQLNVKVESKKQHAFQANNEKEKLKKEEDNAEQADEKTVVEEEQELMEKALELLEMADKCWKKGDI